MPNEEQFRVFALWTFALSCVYTLTYLAVVLGQFRIALFVILGLISIIIFAYWFRDGGVKTGWSGLDESILIILFLAALACLAMLIACIIAIRSVNLTPPPHEFSSILFYYYRLSPIVVTILNIFNLVAFLVRN